jgi:hypothetical protein
MFGSSLPPVVCSRAHALVTYIDYVSNMTKISNRTYPLKLVIAMNNYMLKNLNTISLNTNKETKTILAFSSKLRNPVPTES